MSQHQRYECMFCPMRGSKKEIRGHVFQHFNSEILTDYPMLRKRPYHCPKCNDKKEWRDRTVLVRHFALTHDVLYNYCDRKDAYGRPYSKNKKSMKIPQNNLIRDHKQCRSVSKNEFG